MIINDLMYYYEMTTTELASVQPVVLKAIRKDLAGFADTPQYDKALHLTRRIDGITAKQSADYKALYDHLLQAVSQYFGADVGDQELIVAYGLISRHMTNEPGKVEVE